MRFGGTVLAALLTLGACSSDPEPREPKRTATSAAPTSAPPTMPAQAEEDTPEGAAAFVKHYIDVFNYAASTGDVEELSSLSSPNCKGCQRYIKLYRDTYAAGGYFRDSDWRLSDLQLRRAGDSSTLFGTVTSPPGTYRRTSAETPEPGNAEDSDLTFIANRTSTGWRLATLELQADS
ncbi:DUF6318 family protein [Aeromicrobium sp. NPDC092404]|uniref:DUF6318 family protein n=1 Tax=Aeromicrobium sp. NPDC092404 TaxID=3154976 RepID=UPI003421A928